MAEVNQSDFLNMLYELSKNTIEVENGDEIEVSVNGKILKIKIEGIEDEDPIAAKREADDNRVDKAPRIRDLGDVKIAYIDDRYFNGDYDAIKAFMEDHDIDILIDKKFEGIVSVENDSAHGCVVFADINLQRLERNFGYDNIYLGTDEFALVYGYDGYQDVVISVNDQHIIQYDILEDKESAKLRIKVCKKYRTLNSALKINVGSDRDISEKMFEISENNYKNIVCFKEEDKNVLYPKPIVFADENLMPYMFATGPIELHDDRGYMIFKMRKDEIKIKYHLAELTIFDNALGKPFDIKILDEDKYHFEIWEQDDYLLVCAVLDDHQINVEEGAQE